MSRSRLACSALVPLLALAPRAAAQVVEVDSAAVAAPVEAAADSAADRDTTEVARGFLRLGSVAEEEWRNDQLRGRTTQAGFLLRAPSTGGAWREGVRLLAPDVLTTWNSRIPYSVNDGALLAGAGMNVLASAGVAVQTGPLRLVLAPEVVFSENREFDELLPETWSAEQRLSFRAPWLKGVHAADLPYREGGGSVTRLGAGQSSLSLQAGALRVGASTENEWWGPGLRNAILLSNNAEGFPHLFAQTARPLRLPIGLLEARWIAGGLRRSDWADSTSSSRWRSLSAAALVLHPAPGVGLGVARAVYAPSDDAAGALSGAADALLRWRGAGDTLAAQPFEQMVSLFGRMVLPGDGAEIYAEWARYRLPTSLRDLMEAPEHTQGYTLGGQWLRPARGGELRLQAEHTYLEKSPTYRTRPVGSYYASRAVPDGYTHQGQVLGAAVGPGGSGQWIALDWMRGGRALGLFVARNRWANDAYYDTPERLGARYRGHDVTAFLGMRARTTARGADLNLEWSVGKRYNFLFQNYSVNWDTRDQAVNVVNHTLRLRITPR